MSFDINKLSDNQKKYNLLDSIKNELKNRFALTVCVGAEIEFYLNNVQDIPMLEVMVGPKIKAEKGQGQYEIDLPPSTDPVKYSKYIELVRKKIIFGANELGGYADFSSKPYKDDYGNSMHIHLNFQEDENIEKYARMLCYYLPESLSIFLPKEEDWNRLDERFMAPTHICYGGNNRTAAIRIPDSLPKRLEHRVPAASADPAFVIYVILASIVKGLTLPIDTTAYSKIFGNAFDRQYGLTKIV